MNSLPGNAKDAAGLPITSRDMQELLRPLQSSLQRMEMMLQELSDSRVSPPITKDLDSWTSQIAVSWDTPTCHPNLPTPECSGTEPSHDRVNEKVQQLNSHEIPFQYDCDDDDIGGTPMLTHQRIEHAIQNLAAAGYLRADGRASYADRVAMKIDNISRAWNNIREPLRSNWITRLAKSTRFEIACQLAIVLNSASNAYMTNWEIQHIGMRMPLIPDIVESSFMLFFLVELIIRLLAHRHYFFVNDEMAWNIFDFALVSTSVIDFVLAHGHSTVFNVGFVRLLRILKISRVFRTVRLFRFCSSLPSLLDSLRTSFAPLFWGFLLLLCVLYLFAIVFIQGLLGPLSEDNDIHPATRLDVDLRFGSLGKAMFTLYLSVTGGEDWATLHNLLWQVAGSNYSFLFIVWIFLATFAVFNIITGSIVERAMSASKPARSDLIMGQRKKHAEEKREFLEVCKAIDSKGKGTISWPEFKHWMQSPMMMAYMASLGCDIHDVELFFATVGARQGNDLIPLNQGDVTFEHFVEGCMHMKGTATSIDMQRQLFEMHVLQEDLKRFKASCLTKLGRLEQFIAESCQHEPHNRFRL